ncbi:fibronectin type III domain-containing protein [Dyadobacter sp. CY312]|uniref:fibronectin type III domain-containing protein n=1 Tax=Dyadobacter sp. CY312 TaxID=2907303 RepID=UPI001F346C81|nr:fibronectin type III domain-containing protein [Dyadobacter sp. CY312]MCE7043286.1 fibronectin type III domain-containing protein [Dyadobacter sp. CY312]
MKKRLLLNILLPLVIGLAHVLMNTHVASAQTLSATVISYRQVNLSWQKFVHEGNSVQVEYKWVGIHSNFNALATVTETASGTQSYQDKAAGSGIQIAYRLRYTYYEPGMIAVITRYSPEAVVTTPAAPPHDPLNLVFVDSTATQMSLRWNANQGKDGGAAYVIERSTDGRNFSQVHETAFLETSLPSYTDTGLNPGTKYCYRVKARGRGGDSGYSNTVCGSTKQGAPNSPSALIAKANLVFQIQLNWIDRSNNETGFEIERSADNNTFTKIATTGANVTQYIDGPLTPGTRYYYRIRAINSVGASGYTEVANDVTAQSPPATPAGLSASTASSSQINLTWRDVSDNESGFELERSTDGTNFSKVADIGANTTSHENGGLNPLTKYWYRIRAKNSGGYSGYSNVTEATTHDNTPNTPQNLNATPISNTQINLSWGDNSGNETGFELERSTDGSNFAKLTDLPANATTYQNTGLSTLTKYWYRIRAKNAVGNSGYSNVAEATTFDVPPVAPTSLTATTISASQIDLAWKDNSGNESGFDIERSTDGTNFAKVGETGANATSFSSNDLAPATKYWYRVRSKNSQGGSTYTNVADATTRDVAPNTPQNLSATPVSNTQIRVSWNDNSGNESGFELERSGDGTAFAKIADLPANTTSYENTGLTTLTKYWYRIRAKNAIGNSGYSNVAETTTFDVPPVAPTSLTATTISASQIDLAWKDNSGNESGFDIERSTDGTNFAKVGETGANATSFSSNDLAPATKYWYRVRSKNSQGGSTYTNVADATTRDVAPNTPQNLSAAPVSNTQIRVSWNDNSGNESGFELERSGDGITFMKITDLPANTTSYENTGLTTLTKYWYRIRAKNAIGNSGYSNVAETTTYDVPPTAPEGLTATTVSSSQINLAWKDMSANETGFQLERSTDGTNFTKIADLASNTISYQNTGLSPATKYWYRVRAVNTANPSVFSNVANATTIDVLPLAPENLAATVINYGQIDLAWADKSRNEAGFQLERSADGTNFAKIADVAANAVSYQDKTAASLTKYYYRVRAINPIGPSAYSNIASATTPQAPIPDKPQNLTATPVDFDLIQLKWSVLSRNATSVVIERSDKADQGFVQIGNQAAAIIEFGDREILPINDYYYRIKAVNVAGSSVYSDVVKVDASAIITGVEPSASSGDLIYVYNRVLYVKRYSPVKATLRMFSSNGTRLMQYQVSQDFKTELQNLSSGVYIVVVESDREIVTQKVLVN